MLSFGKQGLLRLTGPGGLRVLKLDSGFGTRVQRVVVGAFRRHYE